jgi:general secretion pathway protein F
LDLVQILVVFSTGGDYNLMPYFQYQARDVQGEVHRGVLDAPSEQEAARKLKATRLYPVKIKMVRNRSRRSVPKEQIIRFFYDLGDLLSAGLALDRSLSLITTNLSHKEFQRVVQDVLQGVQGGRDLSDALGNYRDIFGDLAHHMVRAGENSGALPPILKRVAEYLEQRRAFTQSIVSAMIYPAIVLSMSAISVIILLVYVIPKFAQIFQDLHQKVPALTLFLLNTGIFLKEYGWVIPVIFLLLFMGIRQLYRLPKFRALVDRVLLRTPFIKKLILYSELTRFCRTLGTMLQSGVPIIRAISLVQQLVFNSALAQALAPIHGEIKVGRSFSNFFRTNELFPGRMGTMLRISEEQGNLGEGLLSLADYFEKETQRSLDRTMTLLGPAIILGTGLIIGVIVVCIFSAIFSVTDIQF